MENATLPAMECTPCRSESTRFLVRYRSFLLSKETILAFLNGLLLLAGFIAFLSGAISISRWLYLASALIGGIPLFLLAARGLFLRHDITAGVMASVAMIAAILVGEYSAAALVVFMFSVGDWLENLTVARVNHALRDLAKLIPSTVTVRRGAREEILPIEQVILQDLVLVRSGERIAVDGRITSGSGSVNQAPITGESMPVEKQAGDEVFAGTLNMVGAFEIQVTRLGQNTTLGQIGKMVRDAQAGQAPVQRIANQYARLLVPITFAIAILVYFLTLDILRSITVLVVVCPCALVLATPTAVAAAIGNAARRGLLVKSGAAIEQVGKIDAVAFDKTGTLTEGKPKVIELLSLGELKPKRILTLAAAVERYSEHPIGQAIVRASQKRGMEPLTATDPRILPGYGMTAWIEGLEVILGRRVLLEERGIPWTTDASQKASALEDQGFSVVPMAVDGRLEGLIVLADTLRGGARAVVQELKRLGVAEVVLITGDNAHAASLVADELGISRVFAEVLPQDKLCIVRQLQAEGRKVAFVGDGVNDGPALAAADVGIAMGVTGSDLALETANVGLLDDALERIPGIVRLSRQTLQVIRQNVVFSMSVNVLAVFLGGFGLIGPVAGALVHELSVLPILANAARLIGYHDAGAKSAPGKR